MGLFQFSVKRARMCDHPIRNSFIKCGKDRSYRPRSLDWPSDPRIGQGPGLAIAPVKISLPLGPSSRQCPRLSRCRSLWPLSLRSVAPPLPNDARHRSELAPCIRPDSAAHGRPEKSLRSRRRRENMPEKLTAGRIASDASRCRTKSGQHIFTRGRSGDFAFLGTAAFHDLSLPIPFERAILPRNYPKSGGNVGQGAVIGSTLCITGGAWTSFDAHRD